MMLFAFIARGSIGLKPCYCLTNNSTGQVG